MPKRKHHYVPKFYLRAFASASDRINLYNFKRDLFVENAALKDQCYKHRFHGTTDDLEDTLCKVESDMAPVLKNVSKNVALPRFGSEEYSILIFFAALEGVWKFA